MRGLFFAVAGFAAFALMQTYAGRVEGHYFPVVENMEIERQESVEYGKTRIWGSFTKIRECPFENLDFRLGDLFNYSNVETIFEGGSKVRGSGVEQFGPWVVQLNKAQLESGSLSIVYHKCHPLWLTETAFYP